MRDMIEIEASQLKESPIDIIGKEWLLVSAGCDGSFNTMTASWGSIGYFFNTPVATIVIRPERYTSEFLERETHFTLTVLVDGHRDALALLGKLSGRDSDKVAESGLTPIFTESGLPTFKEARLVLECRKIYGQMMTQESFVDQKIFEKWYNDAKGNPHKMFMGEIEKCWVVE